jgi:hypothetical protein
MPTSRSPDPVRRPRITSLLPGATEIALALGLGESVVAVSHSCDFPGRVAPLPRVTRTHVPKEAASREIDRIVRESLARGESVYEVDAERLDELAPDLILTQGICQVCAVGPGEVARAMPTLRSAPDVLSLEPSTLEETFAAIVAVGLRRPLESGAGRAGRWRGRAGPARRAEPSRTVTWEEVRRGSPRCWWRHAADTRRSGRGLSWGTAIEARARGAPPA